MCFHSCRNQTNIQTVRFCVGCDAMFNGWLFSMQRMWCLRICTELGTNSENTIKSGTLSILALCSIVSVHLPHLASYFYPIILSTFFLFLLLLPLLLLLSFLFLLPSSSSSSSFSSRCLPIPLTLSCSQTPSLLPTTNNTLLS